MSTKPVLAAQLYTVREFTQSAADLAASLKRVKEIGYTAVQVSAIGPIPDTEVKAMVDDLGLTICITHTAYPKLWNETDAVISQHKLWGCPNVAIGSMPGPYREAGEAGFRRFAAEANAVGEKFVKFGQRTGLDLLFEETDPRYLKAEIDVYWVQHGGADPAAWVRKVAGRMPVVHLKDMVILDGKQIMAEIGEGNLNWPSVLAACKDAKVDWYAVEQDVCQRNPFESLKISYDNLKGMGLS
jgi:sugar phosphate isomerase/epimerase